MPLRHRCEYAAVLPRSLPDSSCPPPREFATGFRQVRAASSPDHQVSSWRRIKGVSHADPRVLLSVPLAEPEPSGSTAPSRRCQGPP